MHFKTSLATAALAAAGGANALNSHRHKHINREILEAEELAKRGLIYAHTTTHIITDVVTVTVYAGQASTHRTVAPTAAFFEPGSSEAEAATSSAVLEADNDEDIAEETTEATTEVVEPTPTPSTTLSTSTTSIVEVANDAADIETTTSAAAPTTSTAAAAASTTTASASGDSSSNSGTYTLDCKRGLAYNSVTLANLFTDSSNICWGYNWGQTDALDDVLFIPTLWGDKYDFFDTWDDNVAAAKAANPDLNILFSFNEPDRTDQAGETLNDYAVAAAAHIEKLGSYYDAGYSVGSPSVTSDYGNSAASYSWLLNFMSSCEDQNGGLCPVSFINTHYYEYSACDASGFKTYIELLNSEFPGYQIWVTEVAAFVCDTDAEADYITEISEWMDDQSYIDAYAYFMVDNKLTDGTSSINSLGQAYIAA